MNGQAGTSSLMSTHNPSNFGARLKMRVGKRTSVPWRRWNRRTPCFIVGRRAGGCQFKEFSLFAEFADFVGYKRQNQLR